MSRILVIDDYETIGTGLALMLQQMGHEGVAVTSGPDGLAKLKVKSYDLVIADYRMEEMNGLEVLAAVKESYPDVDVMLNTAHGTIEIAVEAMKMGAADFLTKDLPREVIRLKIEKVLEYRTARLERERLGEENQYLRDEISDRFGEIVGRSQVMDNILKTVEKVAPTDSSVLIYGESGTGKELLARALHRQSGRNNGPFVKVNCGALPRQLAESELFGHEKGAFTSAVRQKKGKFELAEGGTIFLDEIGDIPLDLQVKLLRVLQEKEFDRVGGEQTLSVDVRVVAATNRCLKDMVQEGSFREDLYYRLEVIPITMPPLREHQDDIPELVHHFLAKKCSEMNLSLKELSDASMQHLVAYSWPGNVRELENVIERTVVLTDADLVGVQDLPLAVGTATIATATSLNDATTVGGTSLNEILEETERQQIVQAMEQSKGVKTQAADILGIKTSALYYKLDKYGLE